MAAGLAKKCESPARLRHRRRRAGLGHGGHQGHRQHPGRRADETGPQALRVDPGRDHQALDLRRPIYKQTAAYGHFGRNEPEFTWEQTDKAEALKKEAGKLGA